MTHGTTSAYRHGCRCDACRKWNADRSRRQRAGWKAAGRVTRRAWTPIRQAAQSKKRREWWDAVWAMQGVSGSRLNAWLLAWRSY